MSPELFKRSRLMVAISGLSLAFVAVTGLAAEIGPLPQLKTNLLKADLKNMGVARVKKLGESKYKNEFRSFSFAPRNIV